MLALVAVAAALAVAPTPEARADGLELRGVVQLTPRLEHLRVYSSALQRETGVRVLTPAGFDPATQQLPVLWLLHGGFGSERDWTDVGNAEALTAGLPLVVVMPAGGTGGWYSDWKTNPGEGPHRWETYHLEELRPFIEQRYGTRTDRGGRAVAGLSMGGFGAMHYASRHPDLFAFAAAFSGAVDSLHPGVAGVILASPLAHQGVPGDVFGHRIVDEPRWRANNPVDLAANLRTVEVELRTGNGTPGGKHGGDYDVIEMGVWQASTTLHQRLDALGIPHVFQDRGPGAHTWPYWRDDLAATLPRLVQAMADPKPLPERIEHVAWEPAFSVWGFDVALARSTLEPTRLTVRPGGFDLTGAGRGTVVPAQRFAAGAPVVATARSSAGATTVHRLVAAADGRVTVPVDLGLASPLPGLTLPPRTIHVDLAAG